MKTKRRITLLALLSLSVMAKSQIYISDDEFEGALRNGKAESELLMPVMGLDTDQQYAPLDGGLLLLGGLGAAYLLKKRRKK